MQTIFTGNNGSNAPRLNYNKYLPLVVVPSGHKYIGGKKFPYLISRHLFPINSTIYYLFYSDSRSTKILPMATIIGPIIGKLAFSILLTMLTEFRYVKRAPSIVET